VLPIPPEMLEGAPAGVRHGGRGSSEGGSIHVRRAIEGQPGDPIQLAHRFAKRYETALRDLAQR
jgi:hypothetical protein